MDTGSTGGLVLMGIIASILILSFILALCADGKGSHSHAAKAPSVGGATGTTSTIGTGAVKFGGGTNPKRGASANHASIASTAALVTINTSGGAGCGGGGGCVGGF